MTHLLNIYGLSPFGYVVQVHELSTQILQQVNKLLWNAQSVLIPNMYITLSYTEFNTLL